MVWSLQRRACLSPAPVAVRARELEPLQCPDRRRRGERPRV